MSKDTVLILGATGNTGGSIVNALLDSANFDVVAAVRPSSVSKPAVEALKARGVEIRLLDLEHPLPEQLVDVLRGVDTVISTILWTQLQLQKPLIEASKKAGVKRFIPCDWGTACVRGVRKLYDEKIEIHEYIQEIGLGYTFIDVGWWTQLLFPTTDPATEALRFDLYGTGDVKTAVTDRGDIGRFVARIITDSRTLNQYVFCWAEETTQNEVFALAKRVSQKKIDVTRVPEEVVKANAREKDSVTVVLAQYLLSLWFRGDNIVEKAKKEEYGGALDARELYPDLKPVSLEEFAQRFYSS